MWTLCEERMSLGENRSQVSMNVLTGGIERVALRLIRAKVDRELPMGLLWSLCFYSSCKVTDAFPVSVDPQIGKSDSNLHNCSWRHLDWELKGSYPSAACLAYPRRPHDPLRPSGAQAARRSKSICACHQFPGRSYLRTGNKLRPSPLGQADWLSFLPC